MGASKQPGEWMSIYLFKCHKVPNGPENRKLVKQAKLFDLKNMCFSNSSDRFSKHSTEMNSDKVSQSTIVNKIG